MTKSNHIAGKAIKYVFVFIGIAVSAGASFAATPQFLIVGTGGVTGVYYPTGGAICRTVNEKRKDTGVRCSVESTQGSVANLQALGNHELDLVVAQSDSQYHAYHGTDTFETLGSNNNLRSVFTLHTEPFTVVASKASGIKNFGDLAGKRVNIGNPGSGQRETMEALMRAKGWNKNSFTLATELNSAQQSQALCQNKIDAFVFTVGHPAASLKDAANSCDVVMVTVDGPEVDKLIAENSFYSTATVPGGIYRGSDEDITTFAVSASLMSSISIDSEVIYQLVKNVIENLDSIQKMHPVFATLTPKSMALNRSDIPIHKGAQKYYQEANLEQ